MPGRSRDLKSRLRSYHHHSSYIKDHHQGISTQLHYDFPLHTMVSEEMVHRAGDVDAPTEGAALAVSPEVILGLLERNLRESLLK